MGMTRDCKDTCIHVCVGDHVDVQVVAGIVFMHDNDIIHLDIKPNNIVCVSRSV